MDMPEVLPRPDVDIEEAIAQSVRTYGPLKASRGFFSYHVNHGAITLTGNVRSPQARRMLLNTLPSIAGVTTLNAAQLFDDEAIRMAVGKLIPDGVFANVMVGAVALTGTLPAGASLDELRRAVTAVAGVRRVDAQLSLAGG